MASLGSETTMRALKWFAGEQKARIVDVPVPTIDPNSVIVKIIIAGVCGTDASIVCKRINISSDIVLGHELVGVVDAIGENVKNVLVGDRVVIDPVTCCHSCKLCYIDRQNLCSKGCLNSFMGIEVRDGGMAKFVKAAADRVFKVPEVIPDQQAAMTEPFACVMWSLEKTGPIRDGSKILILGAGIAALQFSAVLYYRGHRDITLVGRSMGKRTTAMNCGLGLTVLTMDELSARMKHVDIKLDGFDIIIDASGSAQLMEDTIPYLAVCGTLSIYGLAPTGSKVSFDPLYFVDNESTITASILNRYTFPKVLALFTNMANDGFFNINKLGVKTFDLSEFQDAFDQVGSGSITKAQFVVKMD